jgi:uncharacterized protein (TIGR02117 family)
LSPSIKILPQKILARRFHVLRVWHRIFIVVFSIYACSNPAPESRLREEGRNTRSVFIVHDSWHSVIVIKKTDVSAAALPEIRDFPDADYLEFSWGDRDYFPAPDPGLGLALKAAFWSGGSVLHVVGFKDAMEKLFPNAEIIEIGLSEEAFQRLVKFVSDTFSRSHPAVAAEARSGLSSNARFYTAEGKFSILRTCNTWVAEALSSAGLPINPGSVITARSLGDQVRPFESRK